MNLFKKKTVIISIISLLVIAAILTMYYITLTYSFKKYGSDLEVDEEKRTLEFSGESVKILQLSDIQTANLIECMMAYPMVKDVIRMAEPDLIVLTGDNISNGSSRTVLNTFVRFMDSFEIPWALVFGNHDRNSDVSPEDISRAYEESEYCIFKQGNNKDRYGDYYYNLVNEDMTVYSLIFMDSEKSAFTEEQVLWYRNTVEDISRENGSTVPSFVFFHIPIAETLSALEAYDKAPEIGSGKYTPGDTSVQNENTGFFDTAKDLNSTKALFFGHDHLSNTFINYEGVMFCYATKTGKTVYFDKDMLGGNLITVYKDSTFDVQRVNP